VCTSDVLIDGSIVFHTVPSGATCSQTAAPLGNDRVVALMSELKLRPLKGEGEKQILHSARKRRERFRDDRQGWSMQVGEDGNVEF
jgi:hypothetical protein